MEERRNNLTLLLAALFGTALMAGCSLIDDDDSSCSEEQPGDAIGFSVAMPGTTRTASNTLTVNGTGTNEQSLKDTGFGVFASHTGSHPYVSSTTTSNLMWNQQVEWKGTAASWTYSPVVYWPNTDDGVSGYVTFFAYAPYSNGSSDEFSASIVDFSLSGEIGDPWLTYQLGGTADADGADGWKARQVDLLYDFKKDQVKPASTSAKTTFSFRHALACVGDQITLTCSEALQTRLKALYASAGSATSVTLTIDRLLLDYELTGKARLVLNGSIQPNWKPLQSGEPMIHRRLELAPSQVVATATSASACTLTDYSVSDQGIFYIPLEVGANSQKVTATVYYTVSTGKTGFVTTVVSLSSVASAGNGSDLRLTLSIPDL
ncbi:MAG: hypothetical protein IJ544_05265 [Prevotella sp.]|nr:hypothetical protein [Prevotella sp.]